MIAAVPNPSNNIRCGGCYKTAAVRFTLRIRVYYELKNPASLHTLRAVRGRPYFRYVTAHPILLLCWAWWIIRQTMRFQMLLTEAENISSQGPLQALLQQHLLTSLLPCNLLSQQQLLPHQLPFCLMQHRCSHQTWTPGGYADTHAGYMSHQF